MKSAGSCGYLSIHKQHRISNVVIDKLLDRGLLLTKFIKTKFEILPGTRELIDSFRCDY